MEYSNLFVVLMGMGVVFFGLICIILLTTLMGILLRPRETAKPAEFPIEESVAEEEEEPSGIRPEILAVMMSVLSQETGTDSHNLNIVGVRRL